MSDAEIAGVLGGDVVDLEMEAIAMFHRIDTDNNGIIEWNKLYSAYSALTDEGMSDNQIKQLIKQHFSGAAVPLGRGIDMNKWVNGYPSFKMVINKWVNARSRKNAGTSRKLLADARLKRMQDLRGPTGGCKIKKTELRAIKLKQLEKIYTHVKRELERRPWKVSRQSRSTGQWIDIELQDPKEVNLYDVSSVAINLLNARFTMCVFTAHVIKPATWHALHGTHCSMVEMMASNEQPPDYFVRIPTVSLPEDSWL